LVWFGLLPKTPAGIIGWIHGQVVKEYKKGDPMFSGTFEQAWGALVRPV